MMSKKIKDIFSHFVLDLFDARFNNDIFEFHVVSDLSTKNDNPYILKPAFFSKFISSDSCFIPLSHILNERKDGEIKYALTFDDGDESIYTDVFPLIKKNNIPVTLFISINLIGTPGYLSKNQLCEIIKCPLVSIGSHGYDHVDFSKLTFKQKKHEIIESREYLKQLTGQPVDYISYPYGKSDLTVRWLAKKAGYKMAFGNGRNPNYAFSKLFIYDYPRSNTLP